MSRFAALACCCVVVTAGFFAAPAEAGFVASNSLPFTQDLTCGIASTPASTCTTPGTTTPAGKTVVIENVTFRCTASGPVSLGVITVAPPGAPDQVYNFPATAAPDPTGRVDSMSNAPAVIWAAAGASIDATFLFTAAVSPGATCTMTVSGEQF
jgi:hypothetical protein